MTNSSSAGSATEGSDSIESRPLLTSFLTASNVRPDEFQQQAFDALDDERDVLVSAPTGSGKTLIGEYAAHRALARGGTCVYTTPIKALSNQKFRQFRSRFGADAVGLLTGDHSINPDADVVVMTTEVLRNMIYAESSILESLSCVVMDEIHYLGDRSRGVVWEEIILTLGTHVQLVGLSATVSNADELGDWLSSVRGDTAVISSTHRPVPLRHLLLREGEMVPITDGLLRESRGRGEGYHDRRMSTKGRPLWAKRLDAIEALDDEELLPAIYFIFSRAGCDGAVEQMRRSRLRLTTKVEARDIGAFADEAVREVPAADLEALDYAAFRSGLTAGIAAHHAGMLPLFRTIVEELFSDGLIKVVFATETLALGIHMPARAVVLEKLTKFDGEGHVPLTAAQYSQITGRAGRRGIDILGTAVTLDDPELDLHVLINLANSPKFPLRSAFAPDYSMAVNLVSTIGDKEAEALVGRSFAQFQIDKDVVREASALEHTRRQATERRDALDRLDPPADLDDYMALRAKLTALEREHKQKQREHADAEIAKALTRTDEGDVLLIDRKRLAFLGTVLTVKSDSPTAARVLCLLDNGHTKWLDVRDFHRPPITVGRLVLPSGRRATTGGNRKRLVGQMDRLAPKARARAKKLRKKENRPSDPRIGAARRELAAHHLHGNEKLELWAKAWHAWNEVAAREQTLTRRIEDDQASLARRFRRIVNLLRAFGYLEQGQGGQIVATEEGALLARVHSEQELLITEVVRGGAWSGLDSAELAACVAAVVAHGRRQQTVRPPSSPKLQEALAATEASANKISAAERKRQLPQTSDIDLALAPVIHHWVSGGSLSEVLAASWQEGVDLTAGDFVRSARLVLDGLIQVAKIADDQTAKRARNAADMIRRGVVDEKVT